MLLEDLEYGVCFYFEDDITDNHPIPYFIGCDGKLNKFLINLDSGYVIEEIPNYLQKSTVFMQEIRIVRMFQGD
jgi:hypothetical protein